METCNTQIKDEHKIELTVQRPYIAIASLRGLFINLRLEESDILRIYKPGARGPELVDIRTVPGEEIPEAKRWGRLSVLLSDCSCLLVHGIDPFPRSILKNSGMQVFVIEGFVDKAIIKIGEGKSIRFMDIENYNN